MTVAKSATLTSFNESFNLILGRDIKKFQASARTEIAKKLLNNLLRKTIRQFPREVCQSRLPLCRTYHHVLYRIEGQRNPIYFEDHETCFLFYRKLKDTNPVTVEGVLMTERLARRIVEILSRKGKSGNASSKISMPPGFYVFEFKVGLGDEQRTIVVEPFAATSLRKAIEIMQLYPEYHSLHYHRDFRVCTENGWRTLKAKLDKYAMEGGDRLDDFKIYLPK